MPPSPALIDWAIVGQFLQSFAAIAVLLAILVSAGRHIQLLISVGKLLEQLDARFEAHCDDRTIHVDPKAQEVLEKRLTRLEDKYLGK